MSSCIHRILIIGRILVVMALVVDIVGRDSNGTSGRAAG
jgi:hypothetical protein